MTTWESRDSLRNESHIHRNKLFCINKQGNVQRVCGTAYYCRVGRRAVRGVLSLCVKPLLIYLARESVRHIQLHDCLLRNATDNGRPVTAPLFAYMLVVRFVGSGTLPPSFARLTKK